MKFLKEPLLHFLLAGAMFFGTYAWLNDGASDKAAGSDRTVHITANEVAWLQEAWARQWQRPPSESELRGLLTDYLKEELLAREARELQLDQNDTVVRRRLAQKMAFIVEDTARLAEATDEELRKRYGANPARFEQPARISFTQVYFNRDKRGVRAAGDGARALWELSKQRAPADSAALGDPSLLPQEFADLDEQAVASQFGAEFARALFALDPGKWHGPFESGYGLHLVRVTEMRKAQPRPFTAVRAQVLEEWRREKEQTANEQYLAGLIKKYDVVVDESVKPLFRPGVLAKGAGQ